MKRVISLDGLNAVFPARVAFIATDAQFTPKAVETQTERDKLMFKVKLKIPEATALQHQGLPQRRHDRQRLCAHG